MQQYQLISRWIQGEIPSKVLPWQIDLDTTNICNQDCYYCNSSNFREKSPVYQQTEKYLELIEKLYGWRSFDSNVVGTINNIIFSGGGEPTLLPGYEKVISSSIKKGFVVAMNTNGTKLHNLLSIDNSEILKMAYIGLDIDSGVKTTYESIRRSKMKSPFDKIKETALELGKIGAPIDVKCLVMEQNSSEEEIEAIFKYAKEVFARSVHFRPLVLNDKVFLITDEIKSRIDKYSKEYCVEYTVSVGRYEQRIYSKCHQMFLFPSFCSDGNIYLCCEYKGREDLKLCSWISDDFDWREIWGSETHRNIYEKFRTAFCKPCRPNITNNQIQLNLNDRSKVVESFI